jgi:hypothetical protein
MATLVVVVVAIAVAIGVCRVVAVPLKSAIRKIFGANMP